MLHSFMTSGSKAELTYKSVSVEQSILCTELLFPCEMSHWRLQELGNSCAENPCCRWPFSQSLLCCCRTYTTLISQMKGKGRLQQVIDWCGGPFFDGCIVFDECHKAKNFVPGKEAQSTKVSTVTPPAVTFAYENHPDMQAGVLSMWTSRAYSHLDASAYKLLCLRSSRKHSQSYSKSKPAG